MREWDKNTIADVRLERVGPAANPRNHETRLRMIQWCAVELRKEPRLPTLRCVTLAKLPCAGKREGLRSAIFRRRENAMG